MNVSSLPVNLFLKRLTIGGAAACGGQYYVMLAPKNNAVDNKFGYMILHLLFTSPGVRGGKSCQATAWSNKQTSKTRQLLAKAALEVHQATTGDPETQFADYGNWNHDNHLPNGAHADNEEETENNAGDQAPYSEVGAVGQDDTALSAMCAQVIICLFLWWKHCGVESLTSEINGKIGSTFHLTNVGFLTPDELANVSLIKAGFLGCSPQQPTAAITLEYLELDHQICHHKHSFSVQAMGEVLCVLDKVSALQNIVHVINVF
ncbi:uncharacterized protein F5147DRAFT_659545 [Suillus discolor]|uniref:Uncharacterized protein n=1 Tax=Suillus discolor TaxID=1912936 RepID=A0A9P7JKZ2_9AGAM|nr:uncharacterized protein F5147DRAFT_659545 [Suillus discolor]KAG2085334.1 hypothetical protein F5147DRAFT_659545 [Suillus discolor]